MHYDFNALIDRNRQIVISADKSPSDLQGGEERLRSRLEWGLIADIQAPDLETKIAILHKKAERERMRLADEVAEYIARSIKSNVRELEGALTRLIAYTSLGEIQDFETAQIAVQASLTGHLVLSTVHTNDAPGTISRLIDMGIEDYLLSSTIIGVLAQRLVRVACPHCRVTCLPNPAILKELKVEGDDLSRIDLFDVKGCSNCSFTGYSGRTGIFEFFKITDEVQRLILEKKGSHIVKEVARKNGMRTLREDGWLKVKEGRTPVSEVLGATQEAAQ